MDLEVCLFDTDAIHRLATAASLTPPVTVDSPVFGYAVVLPLEQVRRIALQMVQRDVRGGWGLKESKNILHRNLWYVVGLGFVGKNEFEYLATEVFEYKNVCNIQIFSGGVLLAKITGSVSVLQLRFRFFG